MASAYSLMAPSRSREAYASWAALRCWAILGIRGGRSVGGRGGGLGRGEAAVAGEGGGELGLHAVHLVPGARVRAFEGDGHHRRSALERELLGRVGDELHLGGVLGFGGLGVGGRFGLICWLGLLGGLGLIGGLGVGGLGGVGLGGVCGRGIGRCCRVCGCGVGGRVSGRGGRLVLLLALLLGLGRVVAGGGEVEPEAGGGVVGVRVARRRCDQQQADGHPKCAELPHAGQRSPSAIAMERPARCHPPLGGCLRDRGDGMLGAGV